MWSNTKLLVSSSFLIIIIGLGFLWFGLTAHPPPSSFSEPTTTTLDSTAQPTLDLKTTVATTSSVASIEGERVLVTKVVDGDTIDVLLTENQEKTVRFIGIDTPETVDPRRPVGCFGKEASNETKSLLSHKMIVLQQDVSQTDKYGRLLRYVFLPLENGQILFVNDYLVREGFAKVLTYPPDVKYNEQLREAEKAARQQKKGLWGRC